MDRTSALNCATKWWARAAAGRVASVTDKAQKTVLAYDGRGRVTGRLKRVALVDAANPSTTLRKAWAAR